MNYRITEKTQYEDSIDIEVEITIDMSEFNLEPVTQLVKIWVTQPENEQVVINEIESRVEYEIRKSQAIERNKIIIDNKLVNKLL
jgi:hypothetical protein